MMRISRSLFVVAMAISSAATAAQRAADAPPDYMPLGAYLSWERPQAIAASRGIDPWQDVRQRLDLLVTHNVDTIWVTNLLEEDLPQLLRECEQRNLKLIAVTTNLELRAPGRAAAGLTYFQELIPRLVQTAGDSKSMAAWVLSDEPENHLHPFFEQVRQLFGQYDPNRPAITVSTPKETPNLPLHSAVPVLCVDPYPFFAPNDPNGPHTEAESIRYYRDTIADMFEAIGDRPTVGWVMGQVYAEIWGPQKYDENGELWGLPGAYLHWRCPTPEEVRWQIWEAFRAGGRGMFFFTATPVWDNPENASLPSPDVEWKEVFVTEPTKVGYTALITPAGNVTPQLEEVGRVYGTIKPHGELILRWKRTSHADVTVSTGVSAGSFVDPIDGARYLMLVNDALTRDTVAEVKLPQGVSAASDITQAAAPVAQSGDTVRLPLSAGDGAILRLTK